MMLMLLGPQSWGEAGHFLIRACVRMSRDWIFTGPRKWYLHGHLREFASIIPISQRGVHISEESRRWASLKNAEAKPHMLKRYTALRITASQFTVYWTKGYVGIVPHNLSHQKWLCFLLKGYSNAAFPPPPTRAVLLIAKPVFMVHLQNKCKIVLASDEPSLLLATGTPSASWVGTVNTAG